MVALPGLLLVAMIALGIVVSRPGLDSPRPKCPPLTDEPDDEKVRARLWQDPLTAIEQARTGNVPMPCGILTGMFCGHRGSVSRAERASAWNEEFTEKDTLVLSVLLDGRPYDDAAEHRLRTRYAVLAALSTSGYVPVDYEFLRVAQFNELSVPYERYRFDRSRPNERLAEGHATKVIVFWVDYSPLGDRPITELIQAGRGYVRPSRLRIIGPPHSDGLRDIYRDLSENHAEDCPHRNSRTIISPWATVPTGRLLEGTEVTSKAGKRAVDRTVPDDEKTCEALRDELASRRVLSTKADKGKKHVVLISEWDTQYGRVLADTFRKTLADHGTTGLDTFVYMRGLDGRLPGEDAPIEKKSESLSWNVSKQPEAPETNSAGALDKAQTDYLIRLGQQLYDLEREYKRDGGRIDAIGIVGSDVYDKLLILRALRSSFPGVVFFTTDLDARLMDKREQEWARNLVVASPFGLRLNQDLQGDIAPFRDAYQTSVYFATLKALDHRGTDLTGDLSVRMFEIARIGAFDFGAAGADAPWPHPFGDGRRAATFYTQAWFTVAGVLVLACLIIPACGRHLLFVVRIRRLLRKRTWRRVASFLKPGWWVAIPVFLLIEGVVLAIAIYKSHHRPLEEPWSAWGGVSVWPTIILRYLGVILCALYFWIMVRRVKRNVAALQKGFFDAVPETTITWKKIVASALFLPIPANDVEEIWSEYLKRRRYWVRGVRVALGVVIFVVGFMLLFFGLGKPYPPTRGGISYWSHVISIFEAVIAQNILLFIVLDVTVLSSWLVRHLLRSSGPARWTNNKYRKATAERGLLPEDLHEWRSVQLIGQHTAAIDPLIHFPAVVLVVMMLSRHRVFDAWDWPIPLQAVLLSSFLLLLYAAETLRCAAKKEKGNIVRRMRDHLARNYWRGQSFRERFQRVIDEVDNERRGAFSPLRENPILKALLIPAGSLGAVALLEYFRALH